LQQNDSFAIIIRVAKKEDKRMFENKENFKKAFERRIIEKYGRSVQESHISERFDVLGNMVRDYASINWKATKEKTLQNQSRQMVYFSMEFLLGKMMNNNLRNLHIYDVAKEGLKDFDIDIQDLINLEPDAGLGNGGLGRLAACFMDSLTSLNLPGHGNCIRYQYGFFRQKIENNKQIEIPDQWLNYGNVWEIRKPKHAVNVKFYGHVVAHQLGENRMVFSTENCEYVRAVPYDMPMIGYNGETVTTLRLWSAEPAVENLPKHKDFDAYLRETTEISRALYPDDSTQHGKFLRLKQQYFFVSAGIYSCIRAHMRRYKNIRTIHEKYIFQLNDTHPALAIPEMMRILLDEYYLEWDEAWNIVSHMMCYTNHTILSEALEKWPVDYIQTLLPRIYMIIEEINRRFIIFAKSQNVSDDKLKNMLIIKDGLVYMANLAVIGSYSVNGVAALHTKILMEEEMADFNHLYPHKFNNKTNGITHRRWLAYANPELTHFLNQYLKENFIEEPSCLETLLPHIDNPNVLEEFLNIKKQRKEILARFIKEKTNIEVDTNSIFDTQVKRLHAYKRQLLNCLHIIYLYQNLLNHPEEKIYPRTFIFAAKAAPSYYFAKKVIELINCMALKINSDPRVNKYLKVVFLENYDVTSSEIIIPGSDVSEQISLAGKEASGTGNMKFMMNGAITLGTLDGANVEISQLVGENNCVLFGLKSFEAKELINSGTYNAFKTYMENKELKNVVDSLINGTWHNKLDEFKVLYDELLFKNDEYLLLIDFNDYIRAQKDIERLYQNRHLWAKMCLVNIAKSGFFSSDRTIKEYAQDIWKINRI